MTNHIAADLPRLLYVADVPVEMSYHGSLFLYRLLQDYPPDKLCMIESNLYPSEPQRRLRNVRYESFFIGLERLLRTRLHKLYATILTRTAPNRVGRVEQRLRGFKPEAVLTVSHGYSWITAARFAAKYQLPLHLICHDDWPRVADVLQAFRNSADKTFAAIYRQAVSRLCVSSFMRNAYLERYGVEGNVLLPFRGKDSVRYDNPPPRIADRRDGLSVAFAGTINTPGYVNTLKLVAQALQQTGGRLLLFGPLQPEDARREGLDLSNVEYCGFVAREKFLGLIRDKADVLFVPMSFDDRDRSNMELSFPSKLADYTAVGLPLLIYGPDYCSAVRWARESEPIAEVVTENSEAALSVAIDRLRDPTHRAKLACASLKAGQRFFSNASALSIFHNALNRAHVATRSPALPP